MIELDIVSHDMFDLPPLSEYELYVKKFGADDTRQVNQGYAVCKTCVPYMSVHTCSTVHVHYTSTWMCIQKLCSVCNSQHTDIIMSIICAFATQATRIVISKSQMQFTCTNTLTLYGIAISVFRPGFLD